MPLLAFFQAGNKVEVGMVVVYVKGRLHVVLVQFDGVGLLVVDGVFQVAASTNFPAVIDASARCEQEHGGGGGDRDSRNFLKTGKHVPKLEIIFRVVLKMIEDLDIRRLDVDTPLGQVHLAAFPKNREGGLSHREVIFEILSEYTGRVVSAENLVTARGLLDGSSDDGRSGSSREPTRPCFPSLDFDVNWTHSGRMCVVAYGDRGSLLGGKGLRIGVDMEVHSPRHLRVAKRFYSPAENLHLDSQDDSRRLQEFFRLWCRKEALFKCVGGSFFEGAVGRCVLEDSLSQRSLQVHFVDVPWMDGVSLCVAVCRA